MEINMGKVLIVVDMQKDFIDGALGTKEAVAIVPKVKEKIAEYRKNKDMVIFTQDTHQKDYLQTSEGKKLPVEHCIEGSDGWKIAKELEVNDSRVICKPNFGWLGWADMGVDFAHMEIELVGLCTDICVVSNAMILKTQYPDTEITVDASCCAGVTPETHKAALATMKMCQIHVVGD